MVKDVNETHNKKPKSTLLKSKSLDNYIDTSTHLIIHSTVVTSPPPFYTKRPNKIPSTTDTPTTDTPIKIYSRINYPFPPPSSGTLSQFFLQTLFQHTRLLLHLFTIATPPPLETLAEVHLPQSNNISFIITVFKNFSTKVDKSTR